MNNQSNIHNGSLFSWRAAVLCAGLMAAALGFTGCATEASKPMTAEQAHSEMIVLREGDSLKITFPGSPNLDSTQQIRRDGKITMPLIGEVDAAGQTPDQLRTALIKLYAPQIASTEINVFVQSSSFPVFVTGSVVHPGKILSDHPITALEAVMEAGGPDYATANLKSVKIIRIENEVSKTYWVNLKNVLDGKQVAPFYMKPQDILYVPERLELF